MSKRSDKLLLEDISQAIARIQRYTAGMTYDELLRNELVADAVMRNVQILGEASNRTSKELRAAYPGIDWSAIIGMRHRLVHDYFEVEEKILWNVIENELPKLYGQVQEMLANVKE